MITTQEINCRTKKAHELTSPGVSMYVLINNIQT